MRAELAKTGIEYEILTAVDGRDLDLTDTTIVDPSLASMTHFLSSTAGAALSHLAACQKILDDGLDEALVLEDDINLPPDLGHLADAVANHVSGAEVVLLSYDSPNPARMSRAGSIGPPGSRTLALPINIRQLTSGGAYLITREACQRMVEFVMPVRVNPDEWYHFYREGVLDRVRCVTPLPVVKNAGFTSTVGSYSLGNGVRARLVWPLVRRKLPGLHQALRYRRQRIYRKWGRSELVDAPFIEKPSRLD